MRVALLSFNAQLHNAIGNQIAEKVRYFHERGAEVRVYVQDARRLHPDLYAIASEVPHVTSDGRVWDYLREADLVIAVYAQACPLWQYLPMLLGVGPRILFDYHGVTPPELWPDHLREGLQASQRERGNVWFADHAITASRFTEQELQHATKVPAGQITAMPLPVDIARFQPNPGERFLHDTSAIQGRILLYVGRLASNKRVPILIEALAKLGDRTLHAAIVGDASDIYAAELARCEELARLRGVADRVHFLPPVDDADMPRVYQSAEVLVVPSLHEGFCLPAVEAMASGVPVVAARSAALPETIADAGLTFAPDDADDLARQLRRVLDLDRKVSRGASGTQECLPRPLRIAVVCFRFGPGIVGGAEASLGVMARTLRDAGHDVRVFTTCTTAESGWTNELPAGVVSMDGLHVERFPINPHDAAAHGQTVRAILDANGSVSPDIERQYLEQSIHSSALIEALRERQSDFDAMVAGPYLFGLTAAVATEFPAKTLLVPCFHDEALARLSLWPRVYGAVGGVLYHSLEEQDYAQRVLGVNHPNAREVGTYLAVGPSLARREACRHGVVYCGRYSTQKNVPLLVEWARRYQAERPGKLDFTFMGQGDVKLPSEPWLRDLGRVEPEVKRGELANARALVQLSVNESLSKHGRARRR
jgi:glycosyltransferase involved in cell wall biosynthesis